MGDAVESSDDEGAPLKEVTVGTETRAVVSQKRARQALKDFCFSTPTVLTALICVTYDDDVAEFKERRVAYVRKPQGTGVWLVIYHVDGSEFDRIEWPRDQFHEDDVIVCNIRTQASAQRALQLARMRQMDDEDEAVALRVTDVANTVQYLRGINDQDAAVRGMGRQMWFEQAEKVFGVDIRTEEDRVPVESTNLPKGRTYDARRRDAVVYRNHVMVCVNTPQADTTSPLYIAAIDMLQHTVNTLIARRLDADGYSGSTFWRSLEQPGSTPHNAMGHAMSQGRTQQS